MTNNYIGIIGYGEVGRIFAAGLKGQRGITSVTTYDRKLENSGTELELLKTAARAGIDAGIDIAPNLGALCDAATLIISAVTASNTLAVAQEAARHIRPGTLFLDLNSASPGTKRQAA
ncbi:NAD(P)-binding domain-containing protein [Glaciimonas sp. CA11.2]|nr:NAD(P)-binding domain-containing protein [Glaciimonas sp. CA11.2]MDY7549128.1 NAD(P)-binding domain-containing protein [Glaciimonas sp. CA11.2]